MKEKAIIRGGLAAAFSVVAAACTSTGADAPEFGVRPLAQMGDENIRPDTVLYEQAVTAIDRRDYATALDSLQSARAKNPDNVRVLNAFGVVYDKLGRFDLSARYYAQALALDPGSRTVAQNVAYSKVLQGLMTASQSAAIPPPVQISEALPAASPVAAPTVPVIAESVDAAPAAPAMPVVNVPDHLASAPGDLTFAGANIELPGEAAVEKPAVHVAAAVEPAGKFSAIAPIAAKLATPVAGVKVSFGDPRPTADEPALRPLAVVSRPVPRPGPHAAAGDASVSFMSFTVALSGLAPIVGLRAPDAPAARPVAPRPLSALEWASLRAVKSPEPEQAVYRGPTSLPAAGSEPARVPSPALQSRRPLRIVNATGQPDKTDPVYRGLSSLGWIVSKTRPTAPAGLKFTTVVYPIAGTTVARTLARTLPFPVHLQPDPCNCHGMQLFIGIDYLSWKPADRHVPEVWRTSLNFAALGTIKGVQ